MKNSPEEIVSHYSSIWSNKPEVKRWTEGPVVDLPNSLCILEFRPTEARRIWTYATCGLSNSSAQNSIELHLFSPQQYEPLVELLSVVAHYHCTGHPLGLGHTVNFGRPWIDSSECEYGLISLPYLDGPDLEELRSSHSNSLTRFLWLIPITKKERDFKQLNGLDALQQKFEEAHFDYVDPYRLSVV